jgi:MFS family permease
MSSLLLSSLRENGLLAARFSTSPVLRVPVRLLWVAVFGGALHAPCTTYFYLAVGATDQEIGNVSAIISVLSMVTAPLYGQYIDRYSAHGAIAAAGFCCAFGCAVRACALDVRWLYAGSVILGFGAASLTRAHRARLCFFLCQALINPRVESRLRSGGARTRVAAQRR